MQQFSATKRAGPGNYIVPVGDYEYSITSKPIGRGGFGYVYKGWHKLSRQPVAIKYGVITPNEIEILLHLKHENIVQLLDVVKSNTSYTWMVMELCNVDLDNYCRQTGILSENTIYIFFRQVASALKFLLPRGIIHRDLKPQNLLLSYNSTANWGIFPDPSQITIKVADFGVARYLISSTGNLAKTFCGSRGYMAPEIMSGSYYNAKADLWSIGVIMFECLTGSLPITANFALNIPPNTSSKLCDLLVSLLQIDPDTRISFFQFLRIHFSIPNRSQLLLFMVICHPVTSPMQR